MKQYDHKKIESKWQKNWKESEVYKTDSSKIAKKKKEKPCYVLDMFPYPSGAGLHVGHPRGYIGSDVYARMKRMQGFNVLHPMGFDSFGLPAEQYAIQTGKHPGPFTDKLVKQYKKQLEIIGFSYDWDRQVSTHDPEYYKWTQWIFLQIYDSWYDNKKNPPAGGARPIADLIKLFEASGNTKVDAVCDANVKEFTAKEWKAFSQKEKQDILMNYRLAYEGFAEVNWCPQLGTVLANDEIVDTPNGPVSERGEYPVEKKKMRQWFMRITAYADRLLSGLADLDWPDNIKEIQKNWIGKSEGLIFSAPVKDMDLIIQTFSAHFEACYADTFVAIAPDHPLLDILLADVKNKNEINNFCKKIVTKREKLGADYKDVEGIFTGKYILDPLGNGELPIWVASFALKDYGTGIVKCSCHDERDFVFAKKYGINMKPVLIPFDKNLAEQVKNLEVCFSDVENGYLNQPLEFSKQKASLVREDIIKHLESKRFAKRKSSYKMRDAIFARQRYWGEPIPLVHTKDGIISEVKEKNLPLQLPNVKSYAPSGNGESPLSGVKSWVLEGYETNTMPGWAGSSWYFLRYVDPKNKKSFASSEEVDYWFGKQGGVDMYVGGQEHATGHLLYSRFWHKILHDLGYVKSREPFKALRNQGMIGGADGRKMSKRWGNIINPDDVVATYGADSLRVFEMFLGPFDSHLPWSTDGIIGSRRFIERVWRAGLQAVNKTKTDVDISYALNDVIKKVSADIASFKFNTAISAMMIFVGIIEKNEYEISKADFIKFLQILAPFAPFTTEEIWNIFGEKKSIHVSNWPKAKKLKERKTMVTIVVQINGKLRGEVMVSNDAMEESVVGSVMMDDRLRSYLETGELVRTIYVPMKLINFVVKS